MCGKDHISPTLMVGVSDLCMSCLCRVLPNGGGNLCTQIYDQVNFKGAKSQQRAEQSRGPEAPAQPEPQVVLPALCSGSMLPAPCSWLCVLRSMCPALSVLLALCTQLCVPGRAGWPDSKVQLSCSRALQNTSLSTEWMKNF